MWDEHDVNFGFSRNFSLPNIFEIYSIFSQRICNAIETFFFRGKETYTHKSIKIKSI